MANEITNEDLLRAEFVSGHELRLGFTASGAVLIQPMELERRAKSLASGATLILRLRSEEARTLGQALVRLAEQVEGRSGTEAASGELSDQGPVH